MESASKSLKALRQESGQCVECGAVPLETKSHCAAHALAFRDRARVRKRTLRDSGICDRCEKSRATIAFKCGQCWEIHKASRRKSENKRIAAGVCERCTQPLAPGSKRLCSAHLAARRSTTWAQLRFPVPWTEGIQPPRAPRARTPARRPLPTTRLDPVQAVIPVVRLWDGGGGPQSRKCSPLKRARTINVGKLPLKQRQAAHTRSFWDVEVERLRPKTRGDCIDGPRPCPWVGCPHHNAFTIDLERGSIKETFPQLNIYSEPDGDGLGVLEQLVGTCSLDIVDRYDDGTQGVGGLLALYQAATSGKPIGTTPGMTIEQTGKALNLSIERVRQLGSKALQEMRLKVRRFDL